MKAFAIIFLFILINSISHADHKNWHGKKYGWKKKTKELKVHNVPDSGSTLLLLTISFGGVLALASIPKLTKQKQ